MSWWFDLKKFEDEVNVERLIRAGIVKRISIERWKSGKYKPSMNTLVTIDNKIDKDITLYIKFDDFDSVGSRIERLRILGFFTQTELCEELDITPSMLRSWEKNISKPREKSVAKMVELFGVSDKYILEGKHG